MENVNISLDEKKSLLKNYNHRLNNDLQALMAFIKIQRRFGIDNEEIINFTSVSIASISAIQNLMYNSDDENLISANEFFDDFIKILEDNYSKFKIGFSSEIKQDLKINSKKMFQLMFLIDEMINMSVAHSFDDVADKKISFTLEEIQDEFQLVYSDNGSGIGELLSESDIRKVLFDQLVKQIDGTSQPCEGAQICVKFAN